MPELRTPALSGLAGFRITYYVPEYGSTLLSFFFWEFPYWKQVVGQRLLKGLLGNLT